MEGFYCHQIFFGGRGIRVGSDSMNAWGLLLVELWFCLGFFWAGWGLQVCYSGVGSFLKPFHCLLLVLSRSFSLTWNSLNACYWSHLFLSYRINTLVRSVLPWSNKCNNNAEIIHFIPVQSRRILHMSQTTSHQRWDSWPTNCIPNDAHTSVFSILPVLHMQDTFALVLNFEVGHFGCHFLLLSFFPPSIRCCYKRNSIHTALLS